MDQLSQAAAHPSTIDIDRFLPFSLTTVTNRLSRGDSRRYLREFGVGIIEWRILVALATEPGATANHVSAMIAVDKAAVSRSLARMEAMGLVTNERRGRRSVLQLTEKGLDLHDRITTIATDREQRLLSGFSDIERDQLLAMLNRLGVNAARLDR
jgi:DNA-binding MarR family transcriptional regulator